MKAIAAVVSEVQSTALDEEVEVQYLGQKYGPACKPMKQYVSEHDGQHITNETKLIFKWLHVRKLCSEPFLCHIRYHDFVTHGRPVRNSPVRLRERPRFVYTVFFVRRVC